MPEPLVSIVVNNFNYARFLPQSIASALAQTHPRTEVIVVDDASTDGSRDVIRSFGERVVSVARLPEVAEENGNGDAEEPPEDFPGDLNGPAPDEPAAE